MFTDVLEVLTASTIRVKMEATNISETTVNFYQTTCRNVPEDKRLHTRRHENPTTHLDIRSYLVHNTTLFL
jgi:hypothetical protein